MGVFDGSDKKNVERYVTNNSDLEPVGVGPVPASMVKL
jgi:hypothetical protein